MTIVYHPEVIQGSDIWVSLRAGLLTASEMHLIVTPTLKIADNDKTRIHLYELMAQRITGHVEPQYVSDDMLRGINDEVKAKIIYSEKYSTVVETGFVTNDFLGFPIGFSPDGLIDDDGLIECKSRRQKFQVQTIANNEMPKDYLIQVQTGLMVTDRSYCDFVSYCGGLPLFVQRIYADVLIQKAIIEAAISFEDKLQEKLAEYQKIASTLFMTEREEDEEEITL